MAIRLIDTHCHLDSESFHQEIEQVVQRATDAGVERILAIGITVDTTQAAIVLSNRFPCVSAMAGIHPNHTHEAKPGDWERIEDLAQHPHVVGIGETGLDKYWDFAPLDIQRDYFLRHIELSRKLKKPFAVHCREAEPEVLEVLLEAAGEERQLSGLMHAFCGSVETAKTSLELGMYLSFGGMLTYKKNDALRETARTVPLDRLLVETDAPYLAPQPWRGKRNEPAYVAETNRVLAEVHGISPDEMSQIPTSNAKRLFRLP